MRLDGSISPRQHAVVANAVAWRGVAWRQHRLIFENATLEEMVAEFNRYNPSVHLRLQGLEGNAHRFDGAFDATDPQALAELLSREPSLAVHRRGGEILISRRSSAFPAAR